MNWLLNTFKSYSGRKAIAALTGLGMILFLIVHLLGNLQIYAGPSALNEYAKALHDSPLIYLGDIGLSVMSVLHIFAVISLAFGNKAARGASPYKVTGTKQTRGMAAVLASKTTLYGGLLLLAFIIIHIIQFRLAHGDIEAGTYGPGVAAGDVRGAIIHTLSNPIWAVLYILGSLATGWHVFHGFQAAFRSMGTSHSRYMPLLVSAGKGLAVILALGFASIPVWVLLAN